MIKNLTPSEKKNTLKVTASNMISKFGDILFDYVNSVFLDSLANGGFWLSLYQSSEVLISVIFNMLGGVVSDSGNRKKIIWYCDLLSGLICMLLAIFCPDSFFIYAILFINVALAVLTSYRSTAYKAVFREIVSKSHINAANSFLEIGKQSVKILGPTGALIIMHFFGNRWALFFDGVSFILSALLISRLTIIEPTHKKAKASTLRQITEGLAYILRHQEILIIILFASAVNFIVAGYLLILPFSTYAFPDPHLKVYALLLTAESLGSLIGASLSTIIKKTPSTPTLIMLICLHGLALMPASLFYQLSHSAFSVALCCGLASLFMGIFNIQFMSFVQTRTEPHYIGRVFGIIFSVAILFMPAGTFFF